MKTSAKEKRILIAEPKDFSQEALDLLSGFGNVTCRSLDQSEIKSALNDYDLLWIRLGLTIRQDDISAHPRCRFIVTATTGLNHLDMAALQGVGIKVLSLKGQTAFLETITATAEHTIGLLLSLVRRIPAAHIAVLRGEWDRDVFKGHELSGKTMGIVGYGRLGKIVASYCRVFRMQILAYDPYAEIDKEHARANSLEQLFENSDFITLHIPLNPSTTGLIDGALVSRMKESAFLINTSRGEVIVELDLLNALEERKIAGAALDVLCAEEYFTADNLLAAYAREHENLILTPHIGGCTWESMGKCEFFMAKMLQRAVL